MESERSSDHDDLRRGGERESSFEPRRLELQLERAHEDEDPTQREEYPNNSARMEKQISLKRSKQRVPTILRFEETRKFHSPRIDSQVEYEDREGENREE